MEHEFQRRINRLSEENYIIFLLHIEGYQFAEIAVIVQKKEKAIKTKVREIRSYLGTTG